MALWWHPGILHKRVAASSPFKVCSYGAAVATAILLQWSQSVQTVWQQQWQSSMQCNTKYFATAILLLPPAIQNGVGAYLLVLPLPQLLPLPHSVNKSIWYCGIQLLRQKNVAAAAATATPSERTFTVMTNILSPKSLNSVKTIRKTPKFHIITLPVNHLHINVFHKTVKSWLHYCHFWIRCLYRCHYI